MKLKLFVLLFLLPFCIHAQTDSLDLKIGQMIMMGLPGNVADTNNQFYHDVKEGMLGGITMYERHLTPENSAENLKNLIAVYLCASPIPLFVAITQEGGQVNRLKTKYGFPPMPSAQYLGSLNNADSTKWYADNTAYTLSRVGININFAPVLDIYNAANPVLGSRERTYSSDVRMITKQAAMVIRSHHYFGVHTALKHFPGHGSSLQDSHLGLTDVSKSWKPIELSPYKQLIASGLADAIMTAHIVNTQLDPSGLPATLSKKVITGLLRQQMRYKGVIFSDDMQMKAIAAEYDVKKAIELALNADVDVLLFSGGTALIKSPADVVKIIRELVDERKVSEKKINESFRRIMELKQKKYRL